MRKILKGALAAPFLMLFLAGCAEQPPQNLTPVYKFGVQTNRSSTNSYELYGSPHYTQPGVNAGKPIKVKPIPSQRGFEPYDSVAEQVYMALNADQTLNARYLLAKSQHGIVILSGNVQNPAQKALAVKIARSVPGVKELRVHINVLSENAK